MIESMRGIYLGRLSESLSVQQVLDCSRYSHQCGGGDPHMVLDWMNGTRRCRENESSGEVDCSWTHKHGLAFERDYPTYFVNQYCVKRINRVGLARIKDYFCNYSMDEMDILAYVYKHGPVTVGVDSTSWQDYLGGIIQHNCLENLNHAVLIVGYDISGPIPYYIVKASVMVATFIFAPGCKFAEFKAKSVVPAFEDHGRVSNCDARCLLSECHFDIRVRRQNGAVKVWVLFSFVVKQISCSRNGIELIKIQYFTN